MHIWPKRRHSASSVLHSLIFFWVFALAEGIFKKENENYIMVLVEKIFNRRNDVKVGVRILNTLLMKYLVKMHVNVSDK